MLNECSTQWVEINFEGQGAFIFSYTSIFTKMLSKIHSNPQNLTKVFIPSIENIEKAMSGPFLAVLIFFSIKLKYATFEGFFFHVFNFNSITFF